MSEEDSGKRRVSHVHMRTERKGCVTFRFDWRGKNSFVYSVAFCSPTDRFCKKLGREIAAGRMAAGRGVLDQDAHMDLKNGRSLYEVCHGIVVRMSRIRSQYDAMRRWFVHVRMGRGPSPWMSTEPSIPRWFPDFASSQEERLR